MPSVKNVDTQLCLVFTVYFWKDITRQHSYASNQTVSTGLLSANGIWYVIFHKNGSIFSPYTVGEKLRLSEEKERGDRLLFSEHCLSTYSDS